MITVLIGGVDKSGIIDWESFSVEQQVTSQVDTARFNIKNYGTKNYSPTIGDSILISDGATAIFGGSIVRIENVVVAGTLTFFKIECVSHERTLDRFLVSREFTEQPARYILNNIINDYVNRATKIIDTMESGESWTQESGTLTSDTDTGDYMTGSQSRKLAATASNSAAARCESTMDLTTFDDSTVAASGDKITFWYKVDDVANFASLRVRFGSDAGATYTNYYEATITATPLLGWNQAIIAKTAFAATGSPNWNDVKKRQYQITATAAGPLNVQIDDTRLVQATTFFSQQNIVDADSPNLGSVKYNYEQVTQAIKQVAEAVGNDWYIDPNRDVHFYQPATEPAPFNLTDASQNFDYNSLSIKYDTTSIRNQVYVRGGEYEGLTTNYDLIADGTALNYRSPYRIRNIEVSVASVSKTVGIDNVDDPAAFDCLYNFQEKTLKFKTATKPTTGQVVRMTGNPMIPVLIKKSDSTSIAQHGVYEYVIIDRSITTQQGGRDRASAELRNYRDTLNEGQFTTIFAGLRAGQTININIPGRSISDDFVVQTVTFRTRSPDSFYYDAKLVSKRAFGIIEYLLGQLQADRKQIVINDNEVVDLVQDITENIAIDDDWAIGSANEQTETITNAESFDNDLDHDTIFVLAPYTPTGFADNQRPFMLDGSRLAGWLDGDWSHRFRIRPVADNGDLYFDLSDAPAGFWSSVRSDGGDVRVTGIDGASQVPCEVSWIDTGSSQGALFLKSNGDVEYFVYYGNAAATTPSPSSTYGRNNVWTDYVGVWHLLENAATKADSTGNSNGTASGTTSVVDGPLGKATRFSAASSGKIFVPDVAGLTNFDTADSYSISFYARRHDATSVADRSASEHWETAGGVNGYPWAIRGYTSTAELTMGIYNGGAGAPGGVSRNPGGPSTGAVMENVWRWVTFIKDRPNLKLRTYVDNAQIGSGNTDTVPSGDSTKSVSNGFAIGERTSGGTTRTPNLDIQEFRIFDGVKSATQITNEYSNFNDPTAYWTVGVEES